MALNATFNNISVTLWQSVLLVDAVVLFECENSAIDVIINFMKNIPQANRTCGFDHR
jgi:hypothetical protein